MRPSPAVPPRALRGSPADAPTLERARFLGHRVGPGIVQRVHPAFNDFNYWRLPIDGEPHPLSPEGQLNRLTGLYGEDLGKELLYTDAKEEDALPREKIIEKFLGAKKDDPELRERALNALVAVPADNKALQTHLDRLSAPPDELVAQKVLAGPRKGKVLKDAQRCNLPIRSGKKYPSDFLAPIKKGEVVSVVDEIVGQKDAPDQYQVKPRLGPEDKSEGNLWYVLKGDLEVGETPVLADFGKVPMFGKGNVPALEDIVQQRLGDCFVLAALGSIVATKPAYVQSMIKGPDSDTPAVRFFRRKGGKRVSFEPEWVSVDKKMFVDPKTRESLYARSEEVLWPALLEKAYALFAEGGHGFMPVDEGGHMSTVFQAILGREAIRDEIFDHPLEMGEQHETLVRLLPDENDRKKLVQYVKTNKAAQSIWVRADPDLVKKVIAEAGLSKEGEKALNLHVDKSLAPALGKEGNYSTRDLQIYTRIDSRMAAGKVIGLGSKAWGEGGTGASGGENVEQVAGLASTHAYMVLDRKETKDGRYFILLRNPWGHFGRGYKKDKYFSSVVPGSREAAPELGNDATIKALAVKGPQFWLELSDVVRYFDSLYTG